MNGVDQRLRDAAEETRQLAGMRLPPKLSGQKSAVGAPPRGWLAFAAAFAAVAVTFGVLPWLMRGGEAPPIGDTAPLITAEPATTWPATTLGTEPEASCSAAGVDIPGEAGGLPPAVADTRNAIIAAAAGCDMSRLREIAGEDFATSFGNGGVDNLDRWENEGQGRLGTLLLLLDMSYGEIQDDELGTIYVWPAAHTYESWDAIPNEAIEELYPVHGEEDWDQFAMFGSYAGWRTGIDQNGDWLYFIAGD